MDKSRSASSWVARVVLLGACAVSAVHAQNFSPPFEASYVVGDIQTRFEGVLDYTGDGKMDAVSVLFPSYTSLRVRGYRNDGTGQLVPDWDITYSGADKKFDTEDDISTINQLFLVNNEPVQISLHAQDVIHSFFLPEFRVKQDAVPGMTTSIWLQPTKAGNFEIACAELCGAQHYRMKGYLTVGTRDSLNSWLAGQ